ncbi:hypothetical protein M569_03433, partial [Genlisea aurea]
KYFPGGDIWSAGPSARCSYVWRGILKSRDLVFKDIRWRIGSGRSAKIGNDPWI